MDALIESLQDRDDSPSFGRRAVCKEKIFDIIQHKEAQLSGMVINGSAL
jgi:hypothetical protein